MRHKFTAAWGAALAACAMTTWAADASAAYVLKVLDRITEDCGSDVDVAPASGNLTWFAWSCEASTTPFPPIRRASVSSSGGGTFTKVSMGFGHSPSVGSNGAVVYINLNDDLVYAYDVAPNTGNCGTDAAFDCEVIPASALGPGVVQSPEIEMVGTTAWIVYREGRNIRRIRRFGVNNYSSNVLIYEAQEAQHYANQPTIAAWTSGGTTVTTGYVAHQGGSVFAKIGSESPCAGNCFSLDALVYNTTFNQLTALIDGRYYERDGSTWTSSGIVSSPQFATGLSHRYGLPRVTRGGTGGLRLSQVLSAGGSWSHVPIDTARSVGRSKIRTLSDGTNVIAYYDMSDPQLRLAVGD